MFMFSRVSHPRSSGYPLTDLTPKSVQEESHDALSLAYGKSSPRSDADRGKEARDSIASDFSNDTHGHGSSADEEPKLPILKKIDSLTEQIQKLKIEHAILSDQVKHELKDATANALSDSEVLNALQCLRSEHESLTKKKEEEAEILKKKYLEEYAERKRLYNEVVELKGNIRVFCRCRPLNQNEIANESTSVVEIDPSQETELQITCADSSKKHFKFDHVFGPQDSQESVFTQTSPVVTSVLDGYNVCIFAYGQTGTGKTFTMEGIPENRGVNYRTLEELFRISELRRSTMRYELFVSMLEVYNEKIRDLLMENSGQPTKKLEIKQLADGTQDVPGLVEANVHGTDDVWELLKTGCQARSVGSTNANEFSSRSHCLLRVIVKGENLVNGERTKSNLWLVDLAGSERVSRIEVEGERLKESQFINKSLSALGDVIAALASKSPHVPYRNSKLTHLLQSSLGGDCKTLMFVQISPTAADLGETICSLNFASRVRGIEYGPARKQADHSELFKYKQMVEKLKNDEKEVRKLQDSVQSLQLRLAAREHSCKSLQDKVRDLENQLAEERRLRLKQETRAVAASSKPSVLPSKTSLNTAPTTEKKPPLCPSKMRFPLRRISNMMAPARTTPSKAKFTTNGNFFPTTSATDSSVGKENTTCLMMNTKPLFIPRRVSIAAKPPPSTRATGAMEQAQIRPKKRFSIATFPSSSVGTPSHHHGPPSAVVDNSVVARQSFMRDSSSRVRRYSKLFSPTRDSRAAVECTPMNAKTSSRFMGSPPSHIVGSRWKPKHPTVIALQKKPVIWSPLRSKSLKNQRKSSIFP